MAEDQIYMKNRFQSSDQIYIVLISHNSTSLDSKFNFSNSPVSDTC